MSATDFLIAASPVPLGLALYWLVSRLARWAVRRSREKQAEQRAAARHTTMMRYRSGNTLGAKTDASASSRTTATTGPSSWEHCDQPAAFVAGRGQAHSEPPMAGGGGGFSGAGASGSWDSAPCGGADYSSSSSSDSGSCSSSSSGSD
jgi:hypothetical protein